MKKQIMIVGLFVLMFTFLGINDPYTAHADEEDRLEIEVESGLNGKAKRSEGFPVKLTITNNQEDFTGDLVVTLPAGNKVIPINIASGTTKSIFFALPAMQEMNRFGPRLNQNNQQFHLYKGNWEDGHEVPIDSSLEVIPSYIPQNKLVIGVLTDRPDSLNYLKLTSFYGNNPEVLTLEESDIPEDSRGLEVLDLLVINDYSVAELPEQKQAAIKNWVRNGGSLATGSEPGLKQQFGNLANILPVTITGKETAQKIQGFQKLYKKPIQVNNLELFKGKIDKDATVMYKEGSIPLVVETNIGKGDITQFTFDIGHPALADWKGNDPLWQQIGDGNRQNPGMNSRNVYPGEDLGNIVRTFPSLANFNVSTLALIFAAYLLVILPVLYFVLKRMDKREWAWIIIPVLAIVSSVGLYTVGAKDRGGAVKTNLMSVISVNEQGLGSGEGAIALLSKGSGSYTLSVDNAFDPFPGERRFNVPPQQQSYSDLPMIEENGNKATVQFRNVEFWSPRSVEVDYPVKKYGQFGSNLARGNGEVSGKITNNFDYDFQEIYLISGNDYHKIGGMAAGETKKVSFDVTNRTFFQKPTIQAAYQLFGRPGQLGQQSDDQKKAALLANAIRNHKDSSRNTPMIIGFTDESLYPVTVNGDETVQNNLHLFMQPAAIQLPEKETSSLTSEIKVPQVSVESGQIYHNGTRQGEQFFEASGGSYLLTYDLPETLSDRSFKLNELRINIKNRRNGLTFSLYNAQSDSYDTVDQNVASFNQKADEKYLHNGEIVLKVSSSADGPVEVPAVTVEGVINP
ncbi:hypothetical protein [Virgibacillus ihumii]|uniref:hypothetical protein n=1 Tax=Virgibacillus ihumii TaxID=2686091 RepID=UPI00157D2872|nr:hypothetical protein [Virgibacillus ihumii]